MPKSNASGVFCDTCKGDAFTIQTIAGADQLVLECDNCGRPFLVQGEKLWIGDPSGGPTGKRKVSWNWAKNGWEL